MPSPFPGMDPYLEGPEIFPDLHDSLIILLKEALQERLPAAVLCEFEAACLDRGLASLHRAGCESAYVRLERGQPSRKQTDLRLLTPPAARGRPVLVRVPHDERREIFLEIYRTHKTMGIAS